VGAGELRLLIEGGKLGFQSVFMIIDYYSYLKKSHIKYLNIEICRFYIFFNNLIIWNVFHRNNYISIFFKIIYHNNHIYNEHKNN